MLLNAYIDGELDPAHALEVERRLTDDPELAAERARIEALRRVIAERLPREAASPELRRRIAALARPQPFGWRADWGAKWGGIAASVAVGLVVGSAATYVATGPAGNAPVAPLLVASHMRSLMAREPVEGASSHRHTFKQWV